MKARDLIAELRKYRDADVYFQHPDVPSGVAVGGGIMVLQILVDERSEAPIDTQLVMLTPHSMKEVGGF